MSLDLLVTVADLPSFIQDTDIAQAADFRSLTIRIDHAHLPPVEEAAQDEIHVLTHGSASTQALWTQLRSLPRVLQHLVNLTTFSLVVTSRPINGFWLSRNIIADIVNSLPQRCCNIEIDTQGQDHAQAGSTHLCENICRVIPRLQHLRIRLSAMCAALFNSDSAPNLRTVSVNCVGSSTLGGGSQVCGSYDELAGAVNHPNGIDTAPVIAQSLRNLTSEHPKLELATVLDVTRNDYDDRTTHPCYNVRDTIENKTYALPFVNVLPFGYGNTLLRAKTGEDVIASRATIQLLAEGQPWKETIDGLRLPAMMFTAEISVYIANELRWLTVEGWKEQNSRKSCSLWNNERKIGFRLLEAVTFDGLTERPVLKEATPGGFIRYEPEMSDLYPADI